MKLINCILLICISVLVVSCDRIEKNEQKRLKQSLHKAIFIYEKSKEAKVVERITGYPIKIKSIKLKKSYDGTYDYQATVIFTAKEIKQIKGQIITRDQMKTTYGKKIDYKKVYYHLAFEDRWLDKKKKDPQPLDQSLKNKKRFSK